MRWLLRFVYFLPCVMLLFRGVELLMIWIKDCWFCGFGQKDEESVVMSYRSLNDV